MDFEVMNETIKYFLIFEFANKCSCYFYYIFVNILCILKRLDI